MDLIDQLQEIVKETYGAEFRLTCNSKEWRLYIVRSKTNFMGSHDEVIRCAIEEFLSYRKKSEITTKHKFYKKFTYK